MKMRLDYISLFSCAGIGCYGFKLEDFECLSTLEIDSKRLEIQKYNNKCIKDKYYIDKDSNNTNKNVPTKIQNITNTIFCPSGYTLDDTNITNIKCYVNAISQ